MSTIPAMSTGLGKDREGRTIKSITPETVEPGDTYWIGHGTLDVREVTVETVDRWFPPLGGPVGATVTYTNGEQDIIYPGTNRGYAYP